MARTHPKSPGKAEPKAPAMRTPKERDILEHFLLSSTSLVDQGPSLSELRAALPPKYRQHSSLPLIIKTLQSQRRQLRTSLSVSIKQHAGTSFAKAVAAAPSLKADGGAKVGLEEAVEKLEEEEKRARREVGEMERELRELERGMRSFAESLAVVSVLPTTSPAFTPVREELAALRGLSRILTRFRNFFQAVDKQWVTLV